MTQPPTAPAESRYLFAHFVDDAEHGPGEQVYLSASVGDDPLRWVRLNGGRPVLTSTVGTGGARDPFLVRLVDGTGFVLLATDLYTGPGSTGWRDAMRTGSRSIVVWRSHDLVEWDAPRLVEIAPPTAGMAWAPEVRYDDDAGEYRVYFSSRLYPAGDGRHEAAAYNRILVATTRDFVAFQEPTVLVDLGDDTIDMTTLEIDGRLHRVIKGSEHDKVLHQVGSALLADDFVTVATRIGDERYRQLEAPILLAHPHERRWYLFLDQFTRQPQGYVVMETTEPGSGRWQWVDPSAVDIPAGTKHGSILEITPDEWTRLRSAYDETARS